MQYRQLFINYLIQQCEREGVKKSNKLYDEILVFVKSDDGLNAYEKFKSSPMIPPGISKPKHIKEVLKDMALKRKRQSNTAERP